MIYFITVNYYSAELIAELLASIRQSSTILYQLIIVNNSADDALIQTLASRDVFIIDAKENLGFGGACNLGLQWVYERTAKALPENFDRDVDRDLVWLINPDVCVPDSMLEAVLNFCTTHRNLSIVGTTVREPGGAIWFAGGEFDPQNGRILASTTLSAFQDADWIETPWVTGCSLLLNLTHFPTCPWFDEEYFLYYEDFDFCRRYAQQGHTVAVTNQIWVIHRPSSITSRDRFLTMQHSTYSYLLALERYTPPPVLLYRLGRILFRALRVSWVEPQKAIAIIKGVLNYGVRVSGFGKTRRD